MTPLIQTLQAAHACIHADRTSLADSSMRPDNTMEPDDAAAVAEYDAVLAQITGALATLQAQPAAVSDEEIDAALEAWFDGANVDGATFKTRMRDAVGAILALRPQEPTFCAYCGGNDEEPQDHCMDCSRPQSAQQAVPMTWIIAAERVPLEDDGEVFVRFTDGSIGTAWATYWHGASNGFAQWTHPDPDEDRTVEFWMKPPFITAQGAGEGQR